jgi:hypothetical protein
MDTDMPDPASAIASAEVTEPPKGSTLFRKNQKWNSRKEEIRRLYIIENKTLPEVMKTIEDIHGFKAS